MPSVNASRIAVVLTLRVILHVNRVGFDFGSADAAFLALEFLHRAFPAFTFFSPLRQGRAFILIVEGNLAIKAIVALIRVDCARGADGLHFAFDSADLALQAAFLAPSQPIKGAKPSRNHQRRAQRAEAFAIEFTIEGGKRHHPQGKRHIDPFALKAERNGRLERLDFGIENRLAHGVQRYAEQAKKNQKVQPRHTVLHDMRYIEEWQPQFARKLERQFLQRAEWAKPAAIYATAPKQQGRRDINPNEEQHGVDDKGIPTELMHYRLREGQHVDE